MEVPKFFRSPAQLHEWFEKNHAGKQELWIGFYTVKSGKKAATYKEVLDEALCYGWIDGIRKNQDEDSYKIRFTPRKKKSIWSNVNTKRMKELISEGKVRPAGMEAYKLKEEKRAGVYSFEQKEHKLLPSYQKKLKANKKAWTYFSNKAPWYQRTCIHWIMSAKQEATQLKRLNQLIVDSSEGRTIKHLTRD
jgi:uncharacterized protein YdeI (YjbR/CyaY-like superfamily)